MPLTDARLATVLARLGLSSPPTVDRAGLNRLYGAWCQSVPFDNTRKLIALRSTAPGPLPGIDPVDFLDTWLEHGVGGTCWPSCNAFYTVVVACGFDATRVTASMADLGPRNHGTILVGLDGRDYLVDTSMLLNRAVPVTRDETGIDDDPLKPVEYETVDGAVRLWFEFVRRDETFSIPCRLMTRGVDESVFDALYEASRRVGPFNDQLVATRNFPDRVVAMHARWETSRFRDGSVVTVEHDGAGLRNALIGTIGLSPGFVDAWAASGALEASLGERPPPTGPAMPAVPASRRGREKDTPNVHIEE